MKEIIVAGVGSCGINLASQYLSLLNKEHNFFSSNYPSENITVHFQENESKNSHTARFIFLDQNSLSIDSLLSHPQASQLNPDNLISDNQSSQNIFAIPFYSTNCMDQILDVFRKEIEKSDSFQGVILNNSIIGGTGSGLTSKLSMSLKEIYPDKIFIDNAIFPSFNSMGLFDNHNALSIYNATFFLQNMWETSDLTLMSDNDALFQKSIDSRIFCEGKWDSINHYPSKAISSLTSGSRFSGINPLNLRKLVMNTVFFKGKQYFAYNHFEEIDHDHPDFMTYCKEKVTINMGCSLHIPREKYFIDMHVALFRGMDYTSYQIEEFNRNSLSWYWSISDTGLIGHTYKENENHRKDVTILHSGEYLGPYFTNLYEEFLVLFKKKSFLHWYTINGMDEMTFDEAENILCTITNQYYPCTQGYCEDFEYNQNYEEELYQE